MTVVVTGASGHIGANLVRALIERRRLCRAIVREDQRALEGLDVETQARLLGKRPLFTRASLSSLRGSRSISKKKAQEDLGYSARPIAGTIRDTFDWLKSSGRI